MQRARSEFAKDQRRQTLLMAALDEFFEKGFNAARMEDIAARAAVSKGTLYLYFDNKTALFKSLIEDIALPAVNTTLQKNEQVISAPAALQQLLQQVAGLIRTTPLPKLIKVLIADGRNFPQLVSYYRQQVVEKMFARLARMLQQGIDDGDWSCLDISNTSRLIVAPILFSVIWRMVFETPDPDAPTDTEFLDIERLLALHSQHLIDALRIKQETAHV